MIFIKVTKETWFASFGVTMYIICIQIDSLKMFERDVGGCQPSFTSWVKKKLTTEACSPEAWIHVFSVGKSSPFMALIHVSELLLFAQSYGKLMKIALSFLR